MANLLLTANDEKKHYAAIKNLSRLLGSSNSRHGHQQHFCLNCLQGFQSEESRNKHYEYCADNEAVRIDMPEENSFVRFHSGQYQFKVPFAIYFDLEAILQEEEETELHGSSIPEDYYTKRINRHVPYGFCIYRTCAYGEVEDPLKLYRGKDCVEVFCKHIESEAKRLNHMFPERPMNFLPRKNAESLKCHICFGEFEEDDKFNYKVRDHLSLHGIVLRTCP